MKIYQTNDIRNIALVGGAKSGKTTMARKSTSLTFPVLLTSRVNWWLLSMLLRLP